MGEIAEAMLNGLFCEGCGELLDGDEPGYTRYCSPECAWAAGVSKRPETQPAASRPRYPDDRAIYYVDDRKTLAGVEDYVRAAEANDFMRGTNARGCPYFGLRYIASKQDQWRRPYRRCGVVVVTDPELLTETQAIIRNLLGAR